MHFTELKSRIIRYYELNGTPDEFRPLIDHLLKTNDWLNTVFPYDWVNDITSHEIDHKVVNDMNLVSFKELPSTELAFPPSLSKEDAIVAFYLLQVEQSINSPHRYHEVPKNCSVIDVGASEGIFCSRYCDESNEMHLFDSEEWLIPAMHNIKYSDVSFHTDYITPNFVIDFDLEKPLGCIKVDVDGPELEVLTVFKSWIIKYHPMIQVAVYHRQREEIEVTEYLKRFGYRNFTTSKLKMLYPHDEDQFAPYFRSGVLVAK